MKKSIYLLILFLVSSYLSYTQCNVEIEAIPTESTCMNNGTIQVNVSGADVINIDLTSAEYEIQSIDGGHFKPFTHWDDGLILEVPPGIYDVKMRAFCQVSEEWVVIPSSTNVVVTGSYRALIGSATVNRRPLNCLPETGAIMVSYNYGLSPYNIEIIGKPDSYNGPTEFTAYQDFYNNKSMYNFTEGSYIFKITDQCNYEVITPYVTLNSVDHDIPNSPFLGDIMPVHSSGCTDISIRINTSPSSEIFTQEFLGGYWNPMDTMSNYYEIALLVNGVGTKNWQPLNYDGTLSSFTPPYTLPYPYKQFRENGDVLNAYIRIKNTDNIGCEKEYQMTSNLTPSVSLVANPECGTTRYTYTFNNICLPASWRVTIGGTEMGSGEITESHGEFPMPFEQGLQHILYITGADGTEYTRMLTPAITQGQTYRLTYRTSYDNGGSYCESSYARTYALLEPTGGNNIPIDIGTKVKYISRPAGGPDWIYGPPGTEHTIDKIYNTNNDNKFSLFNDHVVNSTVGYALLVPGVYTFEITNTCGIVQTLTYTQQSLFLDPSISYTSEISCNGMTVIPSGSIQRWDMYDNYTNVSVLFGITHGPSGSNYDTEKISAGGTLILPTPGQYQIGIFVDGGTDNCASKTINVEYPSELVLDADSTSAFVCKGDNTATMRLQAKNGVPPYTYELLGSGLPPNQTGYFSYGEGGTTYNVRISDACGGASFTVPVTMHDLNTSTITYTINGGFFCENGVIQLNSLSLGQTTYSWTGPNGFTSNEQRPRIPNATSEMSGIYTVHVTPESCAQEIEESLTITVVPEAPEPIIVNSPSFCINSYIPSLAEAAGIVADGELIWYQDEFDLAPYNPDPVNTGYAVTKTVYVAHSYGGNCVSERVPVHYSVIVTPSILDNTIAPLTQEICYNTRPVQLTGSLPAGGDDIYTYQWQISFDGTTWEDILNYTAKDCNYSELTATAYFRRLVYSGCNVSQSNAVIVEVIDQLFGGTIAADQIIPYGTDPSPLINIDFPSGGTGMYTYLWQYSTDLGSTWTDATSGIYNSPVFSPVALTQLTKYRRQVTSGPCVEYSNIVTIDIYACPTAGFSENTISACNGDNVTMIVELTGFAPWTLSYSYGTVPTSGSLTIAAADVSPNPSDPSGYVYTWVIPGVTADISYTLTGISDTYCSGTASGTANITVYEYPVVSITGTDLICIGMSTTLDPISGGTWISNNELVATVNNLGEVTGISAGNSTFTFTSNGCSSTTSPVSVEECYQLLGTAFPFVYEEENSGFNSLFILTANLYALPQIGSIDPLGEILESEPLYTTIPTYYDGSLFISGTPKNPGEVGRVNNPGIPINWSFIGKTQGVVDNTHLLEGETPDSPLGLFSFENVLSGDYVLELKFPGYVPRYTKVTVNGNIILGHRELIPGDVNGDFLVNSHDISGVNSKLGAYGNINYDCKYDINGDGRVDAQDVSLILFFMGFSPDAYEDTLEWLNMY